MLRQFTVTIAILFSFFVWIRLVLFVITVWLLFLRSYLVIIVWKFFFEVNVVFFIIAILISITKVLFLYLLLRLLLDNDILFHWIRVNVNWIVLKPFLYVFQHASKAPCLLLLRLFIYSSTWLWLHLQLLIDYWLLLLKFDVVLYWDYSKFPFCFLKLKNKFKNSNLTSYIMSA